MHEKRDVNSLLMNLLRKTVLVGLILTFLSSMSIVQAANDYVGVTEGDWFEYSITWEGNYFPRDNLPTSLKLTVLEIDETRVIYNETYTYQDNYTDRCLAWWDVATQTGDTNSCSLTNSFFILKNPDPGDPFIIETSEITAEFCGIPANLILYNSTITKTYLEDREVIYLGLNFSDGEESTSLENFWDRETGIILESVLYVNATEDDRWFIQHVIITDACGAIDEFQSFAILPVVLSITLTVIVYRRKLKQDSSLQF